MSAQETQRVRYQEKGFAGRNKSLFYRISWLTLYVSIKLSILGHILTNIKRLFLAVVLHLPSKHKFDLLPNP